MTYYSHKNLNLYKNSVELCGNIKPSNNCVLTTISENHKHNWPFDKDKKYTSVIEND